MSRNKKEVAEAKGAVAGGAAYHLVMRNPRRVAQEDYVFLPLMTGVIDRRACWFPVTILSPLRSLSCREPLVGLSRRHESTREADRLKASRCQRRSRDKDASSPSAFLKT